MINDIELKAYKLLYQKKSQLLGAIRQQARNSFEYNKDKPEELLKKMEVIGESSLWDYHGIMNKTDIAIIEVLEYLIDDEATVIRKI